VIEVIESVSKPEAPKRVHRSAEEKRRIVEATFAPGTSIARVAREHGVNSNQVFQWCYEYRKGILGAHSKPTAKLLPVVVAEPPEAGQNAQIGYAVLTVVAEVDLMAVMFCLLEFLRSFFDMLECGLFSVSAYHDLTGVLDRLGLRVRGALVNAAAVAFGRESSSMSVAACPVSWR
jgi:transposase